VLFTATVTLLPWLPLVGAAVSHDALLVTLQVRVPEPWLPTVTVCDAGETPVVEAKVSDAGSSWIEGNSVVEYV
jgi:hypothetical protein